MDQEWHVVSFSGGKDSTAMLLRMLELNMRVDEILFCDTGVEFPQMYEHIDKVEKYIGREITRLKAAHDFEYYLLHYEPRRKKAEQGKIGLGFSGPTVRWCTSYLKKDVIKSHFKGRNNIIQYVGIAADEAKRAKAADKKYPLIEWDWTEADALQYCYEKGFDWGGLYKIFNRVSCWCCPFMRIDGCRQLRKHFPELWQKLLEWQHQTWNKYKPTWTVDELDARFAREEEWEKMQQKLF